MPSPITPWFGLVYSRDLLHAEARVEGPVGEAARLGLRVADRLEARVLVREPAALRERVEQQRLLELEPVRGLGLERVEVPLEARPVARLPLDAELVAQVRDADVPPERALAVRDDARAVPVDVGREPPVRDELAEHARLLAARALVARSSRRA